MKTTEEYLRKNSILDGCDQMDGSWVPLSVAMIAVKQTLEGKLKYESPSWMKPSPKEELNSLVREYSKKYPDGEFSFLPMYSFNETHVEGVLCFDWKCQIYHIEHEPIEDVIKLIKGLKK